MLPSVGKHFCSLSQWSSQIHRVTMLLNDKTSFAQNNEQKPQAKAKQWLYRNWEAEMTHSPRLQPHSDLSTKNMLHRRLSSRSSLIRSHFYLQTSILVFKRPIRVRHSCQVSMDKKNHVCPWENRKCLCRNFNNWCEIQTYSLRWVYQICRLKYTIKRAQELNNFHYQDGLRGVWEPVGFMCVFCLF